MKSAPTGALKLPLRVEVGESGQSTKIMDADGQLIQNVTYFRVEVQAGELSKVTLEMEALPVKIEAQPGEIDIHYTDEGLANLAAQHGYKLMPNDPDETDLVPMEQDIADANTSPGLSVPGGSRYRG